jgi:hypothetical protein
MAIEEEPPDWLQALEKETIPVEATEAVTEPSAEEELPDWLRELSPEAESEALLTSIDEPTQALTEAEIEPTSEEELPDWLRELRTQADAQEEAELPPLTQAAAVAGIAAEAPDWLERLGPPDTDQTQTAEAGELLPAFEAQEGPIEEPIEASRLPAPVEGMPDWLVELESELGGATIPPQPVQETTAPAAAVSVTTEPLRPPQQPEEPEIEAVAAQEPVPEGTLQAVPAEPALAGVEAPLLGQEELPEWSAEPDQEPVPTVTVEEMPEWLTQVHAPEPEGPAETEPTPMVESLEWLQELEQTPTVRLDETEKEPVAVQPEAELPPVEEPPTVEPAPDLAPRVIEAPVPENTLARLATARAHLSNQAFSDSAREYEQLVQVPELRGELIQELEETVSEHPEHSELHQVLGDAYVQEGQLQKALQAYREALRKL